MKTIMKTALLACLLLAALQFGQASPAPAPAETKPTTSLSEMHLSMLRRLKRLFAVHLDRRLNCGRENVAIR
ncbi:uncharacterized protein LOC113206160 isoform X2 [Frankliniella occidentalis]|uniref:Uncharacterized protein LOC113206160 isoform X2 n=1 Tax=Frankliniella occidentalis TaxID=133901 RepID=A0A6J1SEZ8_FRAOC|nr:uncharacterized protein LOC113206160 isoform X2 [Frankliniella occidentalis]